MNTSTARSLLLRAVCGATLAVCAGAQAQLVFSASAPQGRFGLGESAPVIEGGAGQASSTGDLHATPVGLSDGDAYFYVTPLAGAMSFAVNAASFSFLWGSPDELNRVTYHTSLGDFSFDGRDLWTRFGVSAEGDRTVSTVFGASMAEAQGVIDSVTFSSGAWSFEYALLEAHEPGTLALALAALMAAGWAVKRRASA